MEKILILKLDKHLLFFQLSRNNSSTDWLLFVGWNLIFHLHIYNAILICFDMRHRKCRVFSRLFTRLHLRFFVRYIFDALIESTWIALVSISERINVFVLVSCKFWRYNTEVVLISKLLIFSLLFIQWFFEALVFTAILVLVIWINGALHR